MLKRPFHSRKTNVFILRGIVVLLIFPIIFLIMAQPISAGTLHFSTIDGRYILTDMRDDPMFVAGIVYDPTECGHTELADIDNDLKLISNAHFNVVRLKTSNDLELTERVIDTADKYYPELMFVVSFKPYQYSSNVPSGMDFQGNVVGVDWSNPVHIVNSKQFAEDFVSNLKKHDNIWAWEIFEDISLGQYIDDGKYYNGYWNTPSGRNEFRWWMYNKYNGNLDQINEELDLWFNNWYELENNAIYPNMGIIGCGDPWRRVFVEFSAVNFGRWVTEVVYAIQGVDNGQMITGSIGDEIFVSGVPVDKIQEWGLDFPSMKSYNADGKSLFLSTAAADINNKPVLISEWGIQTAYLDKIKFAESEKEKAKLISSQALFFTSNSRILGYCYFSLYDSEYLKAPDYGLIDIYGNLKESYYAIKKTNALLLDIGEQLSTRSWNTSTAILLTSDAIYPAMTWDDEFINLFDELYRMGIHPCIVGEEELKNSPEYLDSKYDNLFAISRIYSFGSFDVDNLMKMEEFVERFPGNTLIMLPVTGMYGRNASLQVYNEFHSRKLCGYTSGSEGPSNIWNLWGNDGNTYEFSVDWKKSDIYEEKISGVAKWHWNDYQVDEDLVMTIVNNDDGFAALTVHELDSGSEVITLFPDVYVNELPPSIIDLGGNRSSHLFTHLILEYLDISHEEDMESISYEVGDYRLASYYEHQPKYDSSIWGAKESIPIFDDVVGSFEDNSSFIAKISIDEDEIITETSTKSTFLIEIPANWEKSRTWLHVLDEEDNEVNYEIIGDTIKYQAGSPGTYRFVNYESIPVGIWTTRGLVILVILILVAAWFKTALWTLGKYGGFKKKKVKEVFGSLSKKYPFKAYAIIKSSKKIALQSDNWVPEPEEMMKLFDDDSGSLNLQGYDYDVIIKDIERGVSAAQKEDIGLLIGVEVGESVLVTWSPREADVNEARNGSILFANRILK